MESLVPGRGATALTSDEVGAMVDQLSKLNHAAAELTQRDCSAAALRDNVVDALRAIGKYGGRAAEVAGGGGAAETGWARADRRLRPSSSAPPTASWPRTSCASRRTSPWRMRGSCWGGCARTPCRR